MTDFAGRKLIVVGGTSGIGKMVARLFLQRGGSAVVIGRRDDRIAALPVHRTAARLAGRRRHPDADWAWPGHL